LITTQEKIGLKNYSNLNIVESGIIMYKDSYYSENQELKEESFEY
jgi:hypothetical protein